MATPKRYSKGVTNVASDSPLADLPTMAPNKVHMFFDDFNQFDKNAATSVGNWISITEAAGNSILQLEADGGQVQLYADTDGESASIYTTGCVTYEVGKKLWWGVRLESIEVVDTSIGVGLATPTTDDAVPVDGVYIICADSLSTFVPSVMATNVVGAVGASLATMVTAVWYTLECVYDGVDQFDFYVNGVLSGTLATDTIPTAVLAPWIWVLAGQSHADNKLNVDYFYFAKER